ncbi:MAG: phosphohistidine phosphatase SixA [Verrucomicrobiales bacterium]|nr:phosphohistidine phosphatase SixA [Verrucomicrobiales bacterium]
MKIYFLRHTEAGEAAVDSRRCLTAKGRRDARRIGRFLRETGVRFDLVFSSPLVRAVETAELVRSRLPARARSKLREVRALTNGTTEISFSRWLKRLPRSATILLVGHEPSLGMHLRRLLGGPPEDRLPVPKGALIRVDTDDLVQGMLRLVISPGQIP